jgi:hypothetical protein
MVQKSIILGLTGIATIFKKKKKKKKKRKERERERERMNVNANVNIKGKIISNKELEKTN